jgi:ribose transport system substrate-binding protein
MKKILLLILSSIVSIALISTILLTGCAEVPAEEPAEAPAEEPAEAPAEEPAAEEVAEVPETIRIGWTPPDITGVFRTATDYFILSATNAWEEAGINVDIISQAPVSHTAFGEQVAIIEDFIARGVDVIAISPIEVEVVIPAIKKANEAGIPVVIVNLLEPIADVEVASYIGFDNAEAAAISGYALVDYFGGPGVLGTGEEVDVPVDTYLDLAWWEDLYSDVDPAALDIEARVAIIEGVAGGFFSQARLNGFHDVVDQFEGIEIVGTLAADWNREKGIGATEDFLTANPPGTLDAIWAASNEMGLGAMLACEADGRLELAGEGEVGDDYVAIFTNDVTPESVDRIKEGKIVAETTHGFPDWGWYGTEFAVTLVMGGQVPEIFDIRPRTVYKENADQFYPIPALDEIDWETIKTGGSPRM